MREEARAASRGAFDSVDTSRFNGIWTERIADTMDGFDYDPDAVPTGNSWADFLGSVFHLTNPYAAPTTSYEFDYYNECGDHWRDSYHGGSFIGSGSIGDCRRNPTVREGLGRRGWGHPGLCGSRGGA